MKESKEKYQKNLSKYEKANARMRQEQEQFEKTITELNAEIERYQIIEQN